MKIEIFCLCDAATESLGKLNILGSFDTVMIGVVPATCYQCAVVLRIRFEVSELGAHHVKVSFVDSDGVHVIQPVEGSLNVNVSGSANLILNIHDLRLHKYGEYAIDLTIDGKLCAALPLLVKQLS